MASIAWFTFLGLGPRSKRGSHLRKLGLERKPGSPNYRQTDQARIGLEAEPCSDCQ